MFQENIPEYMPHRNSFLRSLFKWRFLIAICAGALLLLLFSCKKVVEDSKEDIAAQFFRNNILNSDFIVDSAYNAATDITARFTGYRIRLLENTLSDGPCTVSKADTVINGTWIATESYGKLTITLSNPPNGLEFLSRNWRFLEKNLPVLRFAPWGVAGNDTRLYLRRL